MYIYMYEITSNPQNNKVADWQAWVECYSLLSLNQTESCQQ